MTAHFTCAVRQITARTRLAPALIVATALIAVASPASAVASVATAPVPLGTAANYAVLAASTITNTGATTINGDLGLSPGTSVTGFPPGQVNGTEDIADAAAVQAENDLTAAYTDAAARPATATIPTELGGSTVTPGVYDSAAGTFGITGTLTLDAQGDPNAVFIFKAASTLITASASNVNLINGAQASNVFWLVGSSATLGTYSTLQGNVLALASVTVTTGVTVDGRTLARTAAVTLDTDTISRPSYVPAPVATTTTLTSSANPATVGHPVSFTATVVPATGAAAPQGTVVFTDGHRILAVATVNSTGQAVITTSHLTVGLHSIRAFYLGTAGFVNSTSPTLHELVLAS